MVVKMLEAIKSLFERLFQSQRLGGMRRSSDWRRIRKEFMKEYPQCVVTGSTKRLEVHHYIPFHKWPEGELLKSNLRTLRRDVHFLIAHLGSWHSNNETLDEDIAYWREKIKNRP